MSSLQLVPYERGEKVTEWTVILRDSANGKTVLYDPQKQQINLQSVNPDCCPFCRQKLPSNQQQSNNTAPFSHGIDPNSFIDSNYFRYLAAYCQTDPSLQDKPQFGDHLSTGALLQGYYQRFFREIKQLGRGYRGSVFLCQHTLDGVPLGEYAIKKIAVGDSRQWLIRMLREVHTLEQISHYNIIDYKHCWLEDHQFSSFGPPVPCLFILMELANGGNLEEYVLSKQADGGSGLLSLDEIYSFFQDICSGLDHLHRHGIIHKDLKPPSK